MDNKKYKFEEFKEQIITKEQPEVIVITGERYPGAMRDIFKIYSDALYGDVYRLNNQYNLYYFPENYTHPSLQLHRIENEYKYVSDPNKNYNCVIFTYSPYVVQACDLNSSNYNIATKYFMLRQPSVSGNMIIEDVTNDKNEIYCDLAEAFDKLTKGFEKYE